MLEEIIEYAHQRFEPKKSWVFGLDLDGKPKTQKNSKNPKNPKSKPKKIQNPNPKKIQKTKKSKIQTQKISKSNFFFCFLKSIFN
jgi:hypothetical protein